MVTERVWRSCSLSQQALQTNKEKTRSEFVVSRPHLRSLNYLLLFIPNPFFRHQGGAPEAGLLFAHGGQLPDHGAMVPDEAGDALPRQGRRVDGRVGFHRQQLHPFRYPHEQPLKNYEVCDVLWCGGAVRYAEERFARTF